LQLAAMYKLVSHTHRKATPQKKDEKYLPLPSSKRLLESAVADHQAAAVASFAPIIEPWPTPRDPDRVDLVELQGVIAKALGRSLDGDEGFAVARFLGRYAPLSRERVVPALAAVVEAKGRDRHLDFYLGEIAPIRGGER
jgi:hypothetical protein